MLTSAVDTDDWRKEIVDYLKDPYKKVERRIRFQATKSVWGTSIGFQDEVDDQKEWILLADYS